MKIREFAIGDVHGCYKTLYHLLFEKINVSKSDFLYFLGDYIDRGPYSRQVIELIQDLRKSGYKVRTLMGNHEELFLKGVDAKGNLQNVDSVDWNNNGAPITIKSFYKNDKFEFKTIHKDFFRNLENYIVLEDWVLSHAGLNFANKDPFEDTYFMLWNRQAINVIPEKIGFRKIVTGHIPKSLNEIYESLHTNHIYLDGGCVLHKSKPDRGYLVALELNSLDMIYQQCLDIEDFPLI